jgi:hypothetical protein
LLLAQAVPKRLKPLFADSYDGVRKIRAGLRGEIGEGLHPDSGQMLKI